MQARPHEGRHESRAATAIARLYQDLGVLRYGNLIEIPAIDLAGATPRYTATQIREAVKVTGDLVMITGAHAWHDQPDHGQHILRCPYQVLTEARKFHGDELAVILAGQAGLLRAMLHASPALAARFPVIIGFPGYTPSSSPPSSRPWSPKPDLPSPPTPPAMPSRQDFAARAARPWWGSRSRGSTHGRGR